MIYLPELEFLTVEGKLSIWDISPVQPYSELCLDHALGFILGLELRVVKGTGTGKPP